jgi:hypothetical protein
MEKRIMASTIEKKFDCLTATIGFFQDEGFIFKVLATINLEDTDTDSKQFLAIVKKTIAMFQELTGENVVAINRQDVETLLDSDPDD